MSDENLSDLSGVHELDADEKRLVTFFQKHGFKFVEADSTVIRLGRSDAHYRSPGGTIFREKVAELAGQLDDEMTSHPTKQGFVLPSLGYAEFVLRDYRWPRASDSAYRLLKMGNNDVTCSHGGPGRGLLSLPYSQRPWEDGDNPSGKVHLTGTVNDPCIELSNASPLGFLLFGPRHMPYPRMPPLFLTVKFDYGSPQDRDILISRSDELLCSLVYELDVRNGAVFSTVANPLPMSVRFATRGIRNQVSGIRYPKVRIKPEAADLFNFAGHARNNPPLAFLSYYQTLEYFMPSATTQHTVKMIRREINDPLFDSKNDSCILRVASRVERNSRLPEADQLKVLIDEYVRIDRLEEFFEAGWGIYFSARGSISGVETINPSNKTKKIGHQVADRVYQIRNRIVHAKDDPRYQEAKVLLPRSQEAESLGPDIELVRLLASEAILAGEST